MDSKITPKDKGRRSGAERRTKIITPYVEYIYSGNEKRSEEERRNENNQRSTTRDKEDKK